jgi:hypothetical protein
MLWEDVTRCDDWIFWCDDLSCKFPSHIRTSTIVGVIAYSVSSIMRTDNSVCPRCYASKVILSCSHVRTDRTTNPRDLVRWVHHHTTDQSGAVDVLSNSSTTLFSHQDRRLWLCFVLWLAGTTLLNLFYFCFVILEYIWLIGVYQWSCGVVLSSPCMPMHVFSLIWDRSRWLARWQSTRISMHWSHLQIITCTTVLDTSSS